jgi:chromosome segregation ATPase
VEGSLAGAAQSAHDQAALVEADDALGEAMSQIREVRSGFAEGDRRNTDRIEACWSQLSGAARSLTDARNMHLHLAASLDDARNVITRVLGEQTGQPGFSQDVRSTAEGAYQLTEIAENAALTTGQQLDESRRAVRLALEALGTVSKNIRQGIIRLESMLKDNRFLLGNAQRETLDVQSLLSDVEEVQIPETRALLARTATEREQHKDQLETMAEARDRVYDEMRRIDAEFEAVEQAIASCKPSDRHQYEDYAASLDRDSQMLENQYVDYGTLLAETKRLLDEADKKLEALNDKIEALEDRRRSIKEAIEEQEEEEKKYVKEIKRLEKLIPPAQAAHRKIGETIAKAKKSRGPLSRASREVRKIVRAIGAAKGQLVQIRGRL